jgi:glycosyltransferase involved in cell wall biosynthesis
MERKKILLLASHASKGGILNYLHLLRDRFVRDGHDVTVMALYRGDNDDPPAGMRILSPHETLSKGQYAAALLRYVLYCLRERPDVVMGGMTLANLLAGLATLLVRARSIPTHHSPVQTQSASLSKVDRWLGVRGVYARIVCVSAAVANSFADYPEAYRRHLQVVTNGLPIQKPVATRAEVRAKLGLADADTLFAMTGRLVPQKNVTGAVAAAARTQGIVLCMTGDGPQKAEVEALIAANGAGDKVRLLGMVPKQDLIDLVCACDVFMQVSHYEGHSASLLEAIAAHRPLLVSNVPSQVEAVTTADGRSAAVLCDPADPADIARGMTTAAFDAPARARMAGVVAELAGSLRTEANMLDAYGALLSEITRQRTSATHPAPTGNRI